MSLLKILLTSCGIVGVVSVAVISASAVHTAMASVTGMNGATTGITTSQEEEESLEERIKQAIADLRVEAQAALTELGVLDTLEKAEEASIILQRMEAGIEELNIKRHNRVEELSYEQNDLAIARIYQNSAAEVGTLGPASLDQIEKINQIRTVWRERITGAEENFRQRITGLEEPYKLQALPKFDLHRRGRLELPSHASEEEIEEFIAGLREKAQAALDNLGELDTPGKTHRAENIRTHLEKRIEQLENPAGAEIQQGIEAQFAQRSEVMQQRAQTAVDALGELDTLEKAEEGAQIQARLRAATAQLRQQMGVNTYRMNQNFDAQFEEKVADLKQRTQDSMEKLGVLDSPRKVELARRFQLRLDDGIRKLRQNLIKAKRQAREDLMQQVAERQ